MIVTFEKEYLRELYDTGKSGDKKHRYQPDIVNRYIQRVNLTRRVPDIQSLAKYNGLNLEMLK